MITAVKKRRNSLALRIPKVHSEESSIAEGSEVNLRLQKGNLIITPLRKKRFQLSELEFLIRFFYAMTYDPQNRVVSRTVNGTATTYVYDGWKLINEPMHEGDAALDSLQANPHSDGGDRLPGRKRSQYDPLGTEEAYYVQGPGADEPLSRNPTIGQISYYNQDGNGNVTAMTDSSGNVIEHYAYDPFGNVTITSSTGMVMSSSSVGNRFMFTGREYIAAIGLYDYRNRVYSPGLGRFLQTDLIRFQAGDINIYRYVGNGPTEWTDPSGKWLGGAIIGGIAGGISVVANPNFSHLTKCQKEAELATGIGLGAAGGAVLPDAAPLFGGLIGLVGDLSNQLIENGGNLGDINTGELLGATIAGVLVGAVGGGFDSAGAGTLGKILTGGAGIGATGVISGIGTVAGSGGQSNTGGGNSGGNSIPIITIHGGPNHPGGY